MGDPENNLPPRSVGEHAGDSAAIPESPQPAPEFPAAPLESILAPVPPPYAQYPEDLRVPWTWTDLLIFVVLALGATVLLDYLLINIFVAMRVVKPETAAIQTFVFTNALYVIVRQLLLSIGLMLFLYLTLKPRSSESFWRMLGWRAVQFEGVTRRSSYFLYVLSGVPLAVAVQLISAYAAPTQQLPMQVFFQDARSVLMLSAMGIFVAPVVEETIFRGFLYPVIARSLGAVGGVILTGVLFGGMHASQLWGGWVQIALLMMVGIVFTYVRARTRSVLPCYFLHLGYNTFLFAGFFFATRFLQHLPAK